MREGWELTTLEEIAYTVSVRGHQAQTNEYAESGTWPIVDQGQERVVGYTDAYEPIRKPLPLVLFGDHTRLVKFIDEPFVVGADGVKLLAPKPEKADVNFLHILVSLAARQIPSLGYSRHFKELKEVALPLPPFPEQRKIAEILRTWDDALEKLAAFRAAKEQRLVGLRAALLFGELRLNSQRRNWAPTRLGAVTHELTKRNGAKGLGRDFVMGVTKAEGVVPMREQTIAGDISRYKRLPPRAFAYNPMRINVGSIAMNEREEEVLVSPDYVVFACNADGLDPDYLDHLRKTSWWAHYINRGGSGSVRQRTYYDDLAALKLPLPQLDEQKAIAAVLNTARADLAATEREIEAVTLQKRGLMQKLLTGEWRVPLDPSEPSATAEETEHAG